MHPSIIRTGSMLESTVESSIGSPFGCPLCPKYKTSNVKTMWRHLDYHIKTAARFQDTIICRCNLTCRDTGHYHCPWCAKTIIRKEDLTGHVNGCQRQCDVVPPSAKISPSPPSSSLLSTDDIPTHPPKPHSKPEPHPPLSAREGSFAAVVSEDHPYALNPSGSLVSADHLYTQTQSASLQSSSITPQCCQSSLVSTPVASKSPAISPADAVNASAQPKITEVPSSRVTYIKSVKCPHCSLVLYKKNLTVHIQRKHAGTKIITATSDLKCVHVGNIYGTSDIPET